VIFHDFDFVRDVLVPAKADPILVVDPDAVLPCSITEQGFQPIAGRIRRSRRTTTEF
jgi:hypothetical protein